MKFQLEVIKTFVCMGDEKDFIELCKEIENYTLCKVKGHKLLEK